MPNPKMLRRVTGAPLYFCLCLGSGTAFADCTLFQHRDFEGASWTLEDHERMKMVNGEDLGCQPFPCVSTTFEASWNDHLSSFRVDPGCEMTLWEHVNQDGAQFGPTGQSFDYVGTGWNDKASEALCMCR